MHKGGSLPKPLLVQVKLVPDFLNSNLLTTLGTVLFSFGPRVAVAEAWSCCFLCFPPASLRTCGPFLLLSDFSRSLTTIYRLGHASLSSAIGVNPPPCWGLPQSTLACFTAALHWELRGPLNPLSISAFTGTVPGTGLLHLIPFNSGSLLN